MAAPSSTSPRPDLPPSPRPPRPTAAALAGHEAQRRPVPDDFAALAVKMSDRDLRLHYRAGQSTVARWRAATGATRFLLLGKPNLRMPGDFARIARGMSTGEAVRHFGRCATTIRRWFGYAGIAPRETRAVAFRPVIRATLDPSVASRAAQHLRRTFASVHRCDIKMRDRSAATWGSERGLPNRGRGLYFVSGRGVMTEQEMIALAYGGEDMA